MTAGVLEILGTSAIYHQSGSDVVSLPVVIDRDVEVVDETGGYSRQAMASFESGQVAVSTGDWIKVGGEEWDVEHLNKDDGYVTQVMVRPRP